MQNPVKAAKEVLGVTLWGKQEQLLTALSEHPLLLCRSANACGKTFVLAVACLLWLLSYDDAVVVTTSSSQRQLKLLWREIHRLYTKANLKKLLGPSVFNQMELRIGEDRYAVGVSANIPENLGGFHSGHVLTIADEASALEEPHLEALLSNGTGPDDRIVLSGNPLRPSGPFFDASRNGTWGTVSISALDLPGIADDAKPIPGLATRQWIERRKAAWGEDSPAYVARVLGQFPELGTDSLFSLIAIEEACDRECEAKGARVAGIDLARFGDDKSVAVIRQGESIVHVESWSKADLMQSCGKIIDLQRQWNLESLCIDETGLGSGLVDRLKEQGIRGVIGVNAASKAYDDDRYLNRRAELFWALRDNIKTLSIPYRYHDKFQELASIRYKFSSNGRIQIESKADIKGRLGRSPDHADALALSFGDEDRRADKVGVASLDIEGERGGPNRDGIAWDSPFHDHWYEERF